MAFDTALNIVADSAVELSLVSFAQKPTDVFGSTDANIGLLCQLLKSVGRNLVRAHQWTQLQNIWLFQTSANVGTYALPTDFDRVIQQTAWNRTNRLPLGGPISPQEFEFLKARLVGIAWNVLWRLLQGKVLAYPDDTTPGSYTLSYEYISRWWARPSGTNAPSAGMWRPNVAYSSSTPDVVVSGGNLYTCTVSGTSGTTKALSGTGTGITDGTCTWSYVSVAGVDVPTSNGDTILFDPELVRSALKLAFVLNKGLPAQAAEDEYARCLETAKSADTVAPVLSFTTNTFSEPLLGPWNLPTNGTAGQ